MCLFLKDGGKIRIARKNIVVWKLLDTSNEVYRSPYMGFLYYKGRKYTPARLQIMRSSGTISQGFHAFRSGSSAYRSRNWCLDVKVVKMVIPKGSKYAFGQWGEIVSSHIRFPKKGE